jgi:NitT/TauT family transport system permease protein
MSLFTLGEKPTRSQSLILGIVGAFIFLAVWWLVAEMLSTNKPVVNYETRLDTEGGMLNRDSLARADSIAYANATQFEKVYPILPPPHRVLMSYNDLIAKDDLIGNTAYSLWLNLKGYFWAILIAIPLGFILGLMPLFRGLFNRQVDALRYLPLSALTGLFIIWFGIEDQMKIAFLAFGILVYLLPVIVTRIDEVEDVYKTAVFTLGATDWQTIRTVYIPSVFSRLMDDIRVLTAISWTYIIIAELLNRTKGIGSLMFLKGKQGQIDKVFAALIVIILIGFLQDRLFSYLDKRLNPHKFFKVMPDGLQETRYGIWAILGVLVLKILQEIFLPAMSAISWQIVLVVIMASVLIIGYGEVKIRSSKAG